MKTELLTLRFFSIKGYVAVVLCFLLCSCSKIADKDSSMSMPPPSEQNQVSSSNHPIEVPIPQSQKAFCDMIDGFIPQYESAPNDLKKEALINARQQKLLELFPLTFDGWTGELTDMGTASEGGGAYVTIKLAGSTISIKNGNWIAVNTPLFSSISDLNKGMEVKVSGTFVTDIGSVAAPEFEVDLEKIEAPR